MLTIDRFFVHAAPMVITDETIALTVQFDEPDGSGFALETGDIDRSFLDLLFLGNGGLRRITLVRYANPVEYVNTPLLRRFFNAQTVQPAVSVELWSDRMKDVAFPSPIYDPVMLALQCYDDGIRIELAPHGRRCPIWTNSGTVSFGLSHEMHLVAMEVSQLDEATMAVVRRWLSAQAK